MSTFNDSNLSPALKEVIEVYKKGPHWKWMNFQVASIEEGSVSLKLTNKDEFNNINGTTHGGVIAALLDTTMGMTARTKIVGSPVTIQLNIQYIKPAINEKLITSSKVVSMSSTVCFIEGKVLNEKNDLIAFATGSFKVN